MLIVGIFLIVISIVTFFAICIESDVDRSTFLIGFLLGVTFIFGIAIICIELTPENTEFKYPTTEYTLEYEVVSRGEQIDSTYVITKLE